MFSNFQICNLFPVCVHQYSPRPTAHTRPNHQERANLQNMLKVTKKKVYIFMMLLNCVKCVVSNMSGYQGCFVWLMNRCDVSLLRLFPPSGMFDEMQSALSSPGLDSLNSSADLTLDTTGELTVEDVKDFLVWVLDLQTRWQTLLIWSHFIELFSFLFQFSTCCF